MAALTADIQGVHLEPEMAGASCVSIAGDYPGVRIEADEPGQTARICHNTSRVNSISITNATLIATAPIQKEIVILFEHEFPSGVNGKITARAKLQGFFATENGVGVPTGDKLNLRAFFSQGKTDDLIAEPFDFTVGEEMESALFEYAVKKQYLVAGPRHLRGALKVSLKKPGQKVIFPDRCVISLDTGYTFADKLETMDIPEEGLVPGGEGAPPTEGGAAGAKSGLAPERLEPVVPETPAAPPKPKKEKSPPPPVLNLPPLQNPPGLEPLPGAGTTP